MHKKKKRERHLLEQHNIYTKKKTSGKEIVRVFESRRIEFVEMNRSTLSTLSTQFDTLLRYNDYKTLVFLKQISKNIEDRAKRDESREGSKIDP